MADPISLVDSSSSLPSSPPQSPSLSERECNSPAPLDASREHGIASAPPSNAPAAAAASAAHAKSSAKAKGATDVATTTAASTTTTTTATTAGGRKPGRKKKEDAAVAINDTTKSVKEKKVRKPRDPNAPPRKRQKLGDEAPPLKGVQQPHIAPSAHEAVQAPPQPEPHVSHNANIAAPTHVETVKPSFAQIGKLEAEQKPGLHSYSAMQSPQQLQQQPQPPPRPQSSGQRYDPIRSASAENALLRNASSPTRLSSTAAPNARASPSIASLIDPPSAYTASRHHVSALPLNSSTTTTEAAAANVMSVIAPTSSFQSQSAVVANHIREEANAPAPLPLSQAQTVPIRTGKPGGSQRPSKPDTPPNAPSPKPARQKEAPPPVPLGSGLLSNSAFSAKAEAVKKQYADVPNQCIVIDVPMTQETGNYVNFIREVENKYGFDVAHPRLAEHRRRMAQMAAAGAALDPTLGDGEDMPLDESDGDSNAEMGVIEDDSTAAEGKKKRQARKKRANEYDKTDDFIDDTEQMWEEQAMASNNGYFVWSGPLIQEASRPADEKTDGAVSKRGRGRGRGGASRGETSGRGRGRGGRGSRGDGTTRKPRITKAERAKLEIEKQERENYAATAQKSAMQAGTEA